MTQGILFDLKEDSCRLTLEEEHAVILALQLMLNQADRMPLWIEFHHMRSALVKKLRSMKKRSRARACR